MKTVETIQNSEFISVALDGSTDTAKLEQELFSVSYLDENFEPHISFHKISDIQERATSENQADLFFNIFEESN